MSDATPWAEIKRDPPKARATTARATFRLVLPQAPWLACLSELRFCYGDALRRAGCAVTYADNYTAAGAGEDFQLAFGAHAVAPPAEAMANTVIAQSEHHSRHFSDNYRDTLGRSRLIMNMGNFDVAGFGHQVDVVEVPPGIIPFERVDEFSPLTGKQDVERDIDCLFYGSVTPRRAAILGSLQGAGVDVVALYGVLGKARDRYIDRAKVVLDLKQDGDEPDDQTRAFWALSRGACVLSENAPIDTARSMVRICPETVVEHVKAALASADLRGELRRAYAEALGPCNVEPFLSALGV